MAGSPGKGRLPSRRLRSTVDRDVRNSLTRLAEPWCHRIGRRVLVRSDMLLRWLDRKSALSPETRTSAPAEERRTLTAFPQVSRLPTRRRPGLPAHIEGKQLCDPHPADAVAYSQNSETGLKPMPPSPARYVDTPAPFSRNVIYVTVFIAALVTAISGCSSNVVAPSSTAPVPAKRNPVFVPPEIQVPDGISARVSDGVLVSFTGWGVTGLTPKEPLHRYECWSGEEHALTEYCEPSSVNWGHDGSALTFTTGAPYYVYSRVPGRMSWFHVIAILGIPFDRDHPSFYTLPPGPFPVSSLGHEVFVKTVPSHINFF
jgi:hypothetical protein